MRAATLLLALALAGCGSARRGEPFATPAAPPDARLALGERVFDVNCSQCHPGGEGGLAPAINNKPLPGWLMKLQVRVGIGKMPAFSSDEISGEELDALVHYMAWLRRQK